MNTDYTGWNHGRRLTDPDYVCAFAFEGHVKRVGMILKIAADAASRDGAPATSAWRRPGMQRMLRNYFEACDEQLLEFYGCLDSRVSEPEGERLTYKGWEVEYHKNGYALWPAAKWVAHNPNTGSQIVDRTFGGLAWTIDEREN